MNATQNRAAFFSTIQLDLWLSKYVSYKSDLNFHRAAVINRKNNLFKLTSERLNSHKWGKTHISYLNLIKSVGLNAKPSIDSIRPKLIVTIH